MAKYLVAFCYTFEVEAKDEEEAICKADNVFTKDKNLYGDIQSDDTKVRKV